MLLKTCHWFCWCWACFVFVDFCSFHSPSSVICFVQWDTMHLRGKKRRFCCKRLMNMNLVHTLLILCLSVLVSVVTSKDCFFDVQERCFGAVGSGCDGVPILANRVKTKSGYRMWVSVGSILHDNCCVRARMYQLPAQACYSHIDTSLLNIDDELLCALEWRKATNNAIDKRMWEIEYPKYTRDNPSDTIGCDRRARVAFVSGHKKTNWMLWGGKETDFTRRLCAPSGTTLDGGDEEFCCSKMFIGGITELGKSGVCY